MFAKAMTGLALTAATCQGGGDSSDGGNQSEIAIEFGVEPYEEITASGGYAYGWHEGADEGNWYANWSFDDPSFGQDATLWLSYDGELASWYGFEGFETDGSVVVDLDAMPGLFGISFTLNGTTNSAFDGDDFWTSNTVGRIRVDGCPSSKEFAIELMNVEMEEATGSVAAQEYSGRWFSVVDGEAILEDRESFQEEIDAMAVKFCL